MKAIVRHHYCDPKHLLIKEVNKPIPNDDEVLIKVVATTVNRTDSGVVRAKPFIMRFFTGLIRPKRPITGTDFSGIIESMGKDVTHFKIGDHVFGLHDEGLSSHAEYMVFSVNQAILKAPPNLTHAESVSCCEGFHYAYNMINKVNLKSGQNVLINGTTGAIGSSALQYLKYKNIQVTAVCDTKNISLIQNLGADRVIDYTQEDFTKENHEYDFIFDAVGKSSFSKCRKQLKENGIYISTELGKNGENIFYAIFAFLLKFLWKGKKVIFPFPSKPIDSLKVVKEMVTKEAFTPVIDKTYSMEQIHEAFEYVESGMKTGNVILDIIAPKEVQNI